MGKPFLRVLFVVLALLAFTGAGAQVRVKYSSMPIVDYSLTTNTDISIQVRDSVSHEPLPGASVQLFFGKDSLSASAADNGITFFHLQLFEPRTALIRTSFLGYKTRSDSIRIEPRCANYIDLEMEEDPTQINSIIVKADAVAVVFRGDTTVFNAAAFVSRQGDVLRDLLKKFPGVSISGDRIQYQGQTIDRILINGNNLFGKEIGSAMDMVFSNEVQAIKVYQETAVDDLAGDGSQAKERVMDVRTWKPMEHVGQLILSSFAGVFPDGEGNWSAGAKASMGSYSISATRPRILVQLSGGHNAQDGQIVGQVPSEDGSVSIILGKDVARKNGYQHKLSFDYRNAGEESGSITLFYPSGTWTDRADTSRRLSRQKALSAGFSSTGYSRTGNWTTRWQSVLDLIARRDLQDHGSSSLQDGVRSAFRKIQTDSALTVSGHSNLSFSRLFSKPRRRLTLSANFNGNIAEGNGGRVDTLSGTMSREWLGSNLFSWSVHPSFGATWTEPLTGKLSLNIHADAGYQHSLTRSLYTNLFDGTLDLNNTKDFTNRIFTGRAQAHLTYGQKNNGLYFLVGAGVLDILQGRQEAQAYPADARQHYFRPVFRAELRYTKAVHQASFQYDERESVPSMEQLRGTINDKNPLFLQAGNPDLALPVIRKLELSYGLAIPAIGANLLLQANGSLHSHSIASRTVYFTEPTWLESYSYRALAGSSLSVPVNVEGQWDASATIRYDQYVTPIKTRFEASVTAAASETPYYLADAFHRNQDRNLGFQGKADLHLEKTLVSLSVDAAPGRFSCDGQLRYDYLRLGTYLNCTLYIGDHLDLGAMVRYNTLRTTQEGAGGYNTLGVDASLGWRFGKDKLSVLRLFGTDLTNSARPRSLTATDISVVQSYGTCLGRCVGISFQYTFARR